MCTTDSKGAGSVAGASVAGTRGKQRTGRNDVPPIGSPGGKPPAYGGDSALSNVRRPVTRGSALAQFYRK